MQKSHAAIASGVAIIGVLVTLLGFVFSGGKQTEAFATKKAVAKKIEKTKSNLTQKIKSHKVETRRIKRRLRVVETRLVRIDERTKSTGSRVKEISKKLDRIFLYLRRPRKAKQ